MNIHEYRRTYQTNEPVMQLVNGVYDQRGLQMWARKVDAQAFAKAQGWNKTDVRKARCGNFWAGWIVGQLVSTDTFRGFADDAGNLVDVKVIEPDYSK